MQSNTQSARHVEMRCITTSNPRTCQCSLYHINKQTFVCTINWVKYNSMTLVKTLYHQRQIQIHCHAMLLPPQHCTTRSRDVQACFCRHSLSPCPQLAKTLQTTSVSTTCSRLIVNVFIHNIDEFKKLKTHQSCNAALKPTHVCTQRPNIPHIDIQQHPPNNTRS